MAKKQTQQVGPKTERAFLVGVEIQDSDSLLSVEDSLSELALLAETAGLEVGRLAPKVVLPPVASPSSR